MPSFTPENSQGMLFTLVPEHFWGMNYVIVECAMVNKNGPNGQFGRVSLAAGVIEDLVIDDEVASIDLKKMPPPPSAKTISVSFSH